MTESTNNEDKGLSVALAALALAGIFVVGAQIRVASIEKPALEAQLNAAAQRLTSTKAAEVQADEAIQKREEQLKTLAETESKYAALLTELIELSKTDADARAITQKWKIQQQGQPGGGPGAEAGVAEVKPLKTPPAAPQKAKAP